MPSGPAINMGIAIDEARRVKLSRRLEEAAKARPVYLDADAAELRRKTG